MRTKKENTLKNENNKKNKTIANKNAIVVKNLSKRYKRKGAFALKDVNMTVETGDIHGFIGPNGAGKTTLIKILIGAFNVTSGTAYIHGKKAGTVESKKYFGYVPERATYLKGRFETSYRYLYDIAIMHGLSKAESISRIKEVCKLMKIDNVLLKRSPYGFSSGQKKKILIAQALLCKPKLLILDEPAANLDPTSRKFVFDIIKDLNKKTNMTIFLSSHILAELQQYVTGWTILNHGQVKENVSFGKKKFNDIIYEIQTTDMNKTRLSLQGFNLKEGLTKETFFITLNNESEIIELQKKLFNSSDQILKFTKKEVDLETLYGNLIES